MDHHYHHQPAPPQFPDQGYPIQLATPQNHQSLQSNPVTSAVQVYQSHHKSLVPVLMIASQPLHQQGHHRHPPVQHQICVHSPQDQCNAIPLPEAQLPQNISLQPLQHPCAHQISSVHLPRAGRYLSCEARRFSAPQNHDLSRSTPSQQVQHILPVKVIPHDNDVLCGRGVNIAHHSGNERFRTLVNAKKEAAHLTNMDPLSGTIEKRHLAEEIIKHIKGLDPPGRFLKRNMPSGRRSRGKNGNGLDLSGMWEILSYREAVKKACQALRDCARTDRNGYALGVVAPIDVKELANSRDVDPQKNEEKVDDIRPRQAETRVVLVEELKNARNKPRLNAIGDAFFGFSGTKREGSQLTDTICANDRDQPTIEANLVREPLVSLKYATAWRKRHQPENSSFSRSAVVKQMAYRAPIHLTPSSLYLSDGSGRNQKDTASAAEPNIADADSRLTADFLDDEHQNHQSNRLGLENDDVVALSMLEDPGSHQKDHASPGREFDDSNTESDHFETDTMSSFLQNQHIHSHNGNSDPFRNRDYSEIGESDHPGASLLRPPHAELLRDHHEENHLGEFHEHGVSERVNNVRNDGIHESVDWTAEDVISVAGSNGVGLDVGADIERPTVGEYDPLASEAGFTGDDKHIPQNFSLSVNHDGGISYPDESHSNPFSSSSADITSDVAMFEDPNSSG